MSVRTMARVWDASKHSGTELLMLLAIADFADDDGNAYPAVPTLAAKCRMSSRNANFILSALRESGELEVRQNEGPRGTNRYCVVTGLKAASPPPLKPTSPQGPEASFTPEELFTLKPTSATPEAGFPKPLKPTSDEPSLNHQEPPVGASAKKPVRQKDRKTFRAWYEVTKVGGGKIVPDDDPIRGYTEKVGLDANFLGLHWEWFKAKQLESSKTQADWLQTFRNSVKGNYGRLWYRGEGVWILTAAGKQAALAHGFPEDMTCGESERHRNYI